MIHVPEINLEPPDYPEPPECPVCGYEIECDNSGKHCWTDPRRDGSKTTMELMTWYADGLKDILFLHGMLK